MSDPAKTVTADVRYEIRIVNGPRTIRFRGEDIVLRSGNDDIVVLMRTTWMHGIRTDESIAGIIGDEYSQGTVGEFLRLRKFLNAGGIIGLDRDLVD